MSQERQTARLRAVPGRSPVHEGDVGRDPAHNPGLDVIEGGGGFTRRLLRSLGTILLVTFVIGLVGALVLHATIIETQRDLDTQRAEITRLEAETEAMRSALAELEGPERIMEAAQRMGMVEAPSISYLTASPSTLDERTLAIAANQLQHNAKDNG